MSRLTFLNCSVQFLKKVKIRCVASIYSAYYQGTEVDWVRVYGGTRSYLFAKVSLGRRRRRGRKSRDKEGRRGEGGMHAKQEKPGAQNLNTNPVWRVFCRLEFIFWWAGSKEQLKASPTPSSSSGAPLPRFQPALAFVTFLLQLIWSRSSSWSLPSLLLFTVLHLSSS